MAAMIFLDEEAVTAWAEVEAIHKANIRTLQRAMKWVYGMLITGSLSLALGGLYINYAAVLLGAALLLGTIPILVWEDRVRERRWREYRIKRKAAQE